MGYKSLFMILAVVLLPSSMVLAKDYIVGDYAGWTTGFDYQTWAGDKEFFVGDRLIFQYPVGLHTVFKVDGTGFQNCVVPPASEALRSGYDVITLATPGRKWYICGVGAHCRIGVQKLVIEVSGVVPSPAAAPSPIQEKIAAPVEYISPSTGLSPAPGC